MMHRQKFWGFVLVLLGVMALLQAMGAFNFGLSFWPVVWLVGGLAVLWHSVFRASWFGIAVGLWLGGVGLLDMLHSAGVTYLTGGALTHNLWPLLLVALGLSMLFGRHSWSWRRMRVAFDGRAWGSRSGVIGDLRYGQETWTVDGDLDFDHGIGDVKLDLTTAEITPGSHRITANAWIGEYWIRVPDNITVYVDASVGIGDMAVLGEHRDGVNPAITKAVVVPESPVELHIEARMGIGSLRVVSGPACTRAFR